MKTYAGIDLYSTNLFVTLLDETGKVMEEKRPVRELLRQR